MQMEAELTSVSCRCEPNSCHSHADGNLCCGSAVYLKEVPACAGMTGLRCSRVDGCLTDVIPMQIGISAVGLRCSCADGNLTHVIAELARY